MRQNDELKLRGDIILRFYDAETRAVFKVISFENLVVDAGKVNAIKLIAGDGSAAAVTTFGAGTSGTAAAGSDTALTSPFTKALEPGVTYSGSKATFSYEVDPAEGNGKTYREIGLLNANGVLIARKVLDTPIVKTSSFGFNGEWALRVL